jgi:polar amino acid transport system substrate-binding protein
MEYRAIGLILAFMWSAAMPLAAQTVRVAHPAQLAPLISVKDGKTVGLVADILRAAAAREGITIVFIPITSGAARALADGTADAIAPMLVLRLAQDDKGQAQPYDFTDAFVITGGGLFVRAPSPAPSGLAELSGKTVVTPSFGPFVSYIRENFPSVTVVPTSSYAESLDMVVSGRAAAAALNLEDGASVAASYAGKITVPTTTFLREPLALAVAKGTHADLVQRLNAGLAAIRADGTLKRIEATYNRPAALTP